MRNIKENKYRIFAVVVGKFIRTASTREKGGKFKMIRKIDEDIFAIDIPLEGNPLKVLNSYYIRGDKNDLLIDTGFRRPSCETVLRRALFELGADPEKLSVLCTHIHSDHSGMADLFASKDLPVYMGEHDLQLLLAFLKNHKNEDGIQRFVQEGFPISLIDHIYSENPAWNETMRLADSRLTPLKDGELIQVGRVMLETVYVPGHTPGNCMFWVKDRQIMFTGDHILFDITPNITNWPDRKDSLGDYLESLRKAARYPVKIALPGHRQSGDYHARLDELMDHHKRRIQNLFWLIGNNPGLTAYELAGKMQWHIRARSWEDFPVVQKWFAVGECLAHLDYLFNRERIKKYLENGCYRYYIC